MSVYRSRRRDWLYCQRTLRELLARSGAVDAADIRASLKRNQRFMAFERRNRRTVDQVGHVIH